MFRIDNGIIRNILKQIRTVDKNRQFFSLTKLIWCLCLFCYKPNCIYRIVHNGIVIVVIVELKKRKVKKEKNISHFLFVY